jgi:hypothetical protein
VEEGVKRRLIVIEEIKSYGEGIYTTLRLSIAIEEEWERMRRGRD